MYWVCAYLDVVKRKYKRKHKKIQQQKSKKIQRRQIKKSNLIIELDPGHGGNDSGATDGSESRLQEKDINLKIDQIYSRGIV